MTEEHTARREAYRRLRDDFKALPLEDQARFLLEATAVTLGDGLDRAGHAVADELDDLFDRARRRRKRKASTESDGADAPGAAEPETGQQRADDASEGKPGDNA